MTGSDSNISGQPISSAIFTAALNGQAIHNASQRTYTVFNAYSYTKPNGTTGYGVVEQDAPGLTANTKGVISLWTQQ